MNYKQLLSIIFGTIYIWISYSAVSISGSYLVADNNINVFNILYWMVISRNFGNLAQLLFIKVDNTITFNKVSFITSCMPILGIIGWFCYFKLLKNGDISLISPLISLYILIPIIVATIIRKKKFTPLKVISIIISLIASILLTIEINNTNNKKDSPGIQALYFIVCFAVWGYIDTRSAIYTEQTISSSGIVIFTSLGYFIMITVLGILLRIYDKPFTFNYYWIPFWIANFSLPSAWLVYIKTSAIDVSISLPMYSLYFVLPAIWGLTVNNEDPNIYKIVSILLSTLSFILLIIAGYFQYKNINNNINNINNNIDNNIDNNNVQTSEV